MSAASRTSESVSDVATMRRELDAIEATRDEIGTKLTEASKRYEQLEEELASVNGNLVARWNIEEQIDAARAEIRELTAAKVGPDTKAGRLRAVLTPVLQRETEAARRAVDIQQCEVLLEAAALLGRVNEIMSHARDIGRSDGYKHTQFDASMRTVEQLCSKWDTTITPQIRRSLAEHRRFVAATEDER